MSDTKKSDDDIVATPQDEPEMISDEKLEDASGGWSWGVTQPTLTSASVQPVAGVNFETVYGGAGNDDILDTDSMLRTRPGRMPDPYGF